MAEFPPVGTHAWIAGAQTVPLELPHGWVEPAAAADFARIWGILATSASDPARRVQATTRQRGWLELSMALTPAESTPASIPAPAPLQAAGVAPPTEAIESRPRMFAQAVASQPADSATSAPLPPHARGRGEWSRLQRSLLVGCVVLTLGFIAMLPAGGSVEGPGKVLPASRYLDQDPQRSTVVDARIVTVGYRPLRLYEALGRGLRARNDASPDSASLVDTAVPDLRTRLLKQARTESLYVSAHSLDDKVQLDGRGVLVAQVGKRQRESGLRNGDVIVQMGARPVRTVLDYQREIGRASGSRVVVHTSSGRQLTLRLLPERPAGERTADVSVADQRVGIFAITDHPSVLGVDAVSSTMRAPFDSDSCGLAFALAYHQVLLGTGTGAAFAATGALQADGSVFGVGGIRSKAHTVADAGIHTFLVPATQAATVRSVEPGLDVIPIKNFADADRWLRQR